MKGYILVEGHGELGAVDNLVVRLWQESGRAEPWGRAIRWPNLHLETGVARAIERVQAFGDAGALLLLHDADDACPMRTAPELAAVARRLNPPFPVAVVLLCREYEVLFLPCVADMAGRPLQGPDGQRRPGLVAGTRYEGDWEAKRISRRRERSNRADVNSQIGEGSLWRWETPRLDVTVAPTAEPSASAARDPEVGPAQAPPSRTLRASLARAPTETHASLARESVSRASVARARADSHASAARPRQDEIRTFLLSSPALAPSAPQSEHRGGVTPMRRVPASS